MMVLDENGILWRDKWFLEEAIWYLKGGTAGQFFGKSADELRQIKVRDLKCNSSRFMEGRTAKKCIKEKTKHYKIIFPTNSPANKKAYKHLTVSPRVFAKWSDTDDVTLDDTRLRKYLDYKYWRYVDNWTFDQAFLIIHSSECPLPHEIYDVIENEHTYDEASKFKFIFNGCYMAAGEKVCVSDDDPSYLSLADFSYSLNACYLLAASVTKKEVPEILEEIIEFDRFAAEEALALHQIMKVDMKQKKFVRPGKKRNKELHADLLKLFNSLKKEFGLPLKASTVINAIKNKENKFDCISGCIKEKGDEKILWKDSAGELRKYAVASLKNEISKYNNKK